MNPDYLLIRGGYLFGSISTAIIVCKLMRLPDPRTEGSRNPGATNVLRLGGKKAAAITLAGDVIKGLLPVLVAAALGAGSIVIAATGLAAFLGHLYPVFFGFKGGKGVATAAGVLIGVSWQAALVLIALWLAVALLSRYSSLAALTATLASPVILYFLGADSAFVLLAAILAVFLFWRHRANIGRLRRGEESRIKLLSGDR